MKHLLWILIFVVALSGCGKENIVDTDDTTYRLRLVESVSKKPIVTTLVILVPRVILLQAPPGTPDPNLEYALELTTDDNGILYLNEGELKELFGHFESGSGHVDCTVEGLSRFTIEYNPISQKYLLTACHYSGYRRSSRCSYNLNENFTQISQVWGILYSP